MTYILLDEETDQEIPLGATVKTFRGGLPCKVLAYMAPRNENSSGKVMVEFENGDVMWYYPSVIKAKIVEKN